MRACRLGDASRMHMARLHFLSSRRRARMSAQASGVPAPERWRRLAAEAAAGARAGARAAGAGEAEAAKAAEAAARDVEMMLAAEVGGDEESVHVGDAMQIFHVETGENGEDLIIPEGMEVHPTEEPRRHNSGAPPRLASALCTAIHATPLHRRRSQRPLAPTLRGLATRPSAIYL